MTKLLTAEKIAVMRLMAKVNRKRPFTVMDDGERRSIEQIAEDDLFLILREAVVIGHATQSGGRQDLCFAEFTITDTGRAWLKSAEEWPELAKCAQCHFNGIQAVLVNDDCPNYHCVLYEHGHKARPSWLTSPTEKFCIPRTGKGGRTTRGAAR